MTDIPIMSLEQFAKTHGGLITSADVQSHIHAGLRSMPTTKTYKRSNERRLNELKAARDETMRLYRAAIADGEIREMTSEESLLATANGHEDNSAVQAARRVLAKRAAAAAAKSGVTEPCG